MPVEDPPSKTNDQPIYGGIYSGTFSYEKDSITHITLLAYSPFIKSNNSSPMRIVKGYLNGIVIDLAIPELMIKK